MRLRTALIHAAVLLTVLAGCGFGGSDGGASEDKDGPPAGGWPQPDNGKVTDAMCQLLRPGDWRRAGHPLLIDMELEPQKTGGDLGGIQLWCLSTPANSMKFSLQPTAEAGKIYYGMLLAERKDRVASGDSDSMLEENLVEGADESWFDFGPGVKRHQQLKEYQLTFRQGGLVVTIELGAVDDSKEKDPRGTLVTLARLVWERLPGVGRTDTGITPSVHFAVTGTGKADITYNKPQGGSEELKDTTLPWEIQLPTAELGKSQQGFNLSATQKPTADKPYGAAVGCQIAVNGVTVANQRGLGFAICTGFYTGK